MYIFLLHCLMNAHLLLLPLPFGVPVLVPFLFFYFSLRSQTTIPAISRQEKHHLAFRLFSFSFVPTLYLKDKAAKKKTHTHTKIKIHLFLHERPLTLFYLSLADENAK